MSAGLRICDHHSSGEGVQPTHIHSVLQTHLLPAHPPSPSLVAGGLAVSWAGSSSPTAPSAIYRDEKLQELQQTNDSTACMNVFQKIILEESYSYKFLRESMRCIFMDTIRGTFMIQQYSSSRNMIQLLNLITWYIIYWKIINTVSRFSLA